MNTCRYRISCFVVFLFFLLSSCGAKKKVLSHRHKDSEEKSVIDKHKKQDIAGKYEQLLSVNQDKLNINLYAFIDDWMGTSHKLGGMDKSGVDCSGFVILVYEEIYKQKLQRTSSEMAENVKRKYDHQLEEGDLVFFSFGGKNIDHVGIYLHNDKFVHVSTKLGVMVSNLKEPWYYKYFTRCGTPKK